MRQETDLMRRILQSQHGKRIIDFVAPIYGESETALWLFESIGQVLDDVAENTDLLRQQVVPETADWLLSYWEAEYDLTPDHFWNIEQRRASIVAKIKYVAPVNPAKLEKFASAAMGVPCEFIENISKNTFRIVINGWSDNFPRLKQTVNAAKPAHLIWNVLANIPPIIFIEQPGNMLEKDLYFKTFVNYWNCYFFNGVRRFDGSIDFVSKRGGLNFISTRIRTKAKLQHHLSPSQLKIQNLNIVNREYIPLNIQMGRTVFDNMGEFIRLNGDNKLDGSWILWQRARTAIFQNFCVRATAQEEPSVFFPVQSEIRIIHHNPNWLKPSNLKTGILKFASIEEIIINRIQIKHSQEEINHAPLLQKTVFSPFGLKNKENVFLFQNWHIKWREKQSFSLCQSDFFSILKESTGNGILHLSSGIFSITDAQEKICSNVYWHSGTKKQTPVSSLVRMDISTKVSSLASKKIIQKFYFAPYSFHNYNEMGNAFLTVTESSHSDGKESFDGALIFNGKAIPKTEMI